MSVQAVAAALNVPVSAMPRFALFLLSDSSAERRGAVVSDREASDLTAKGFTAPEAAAWLGWLEDNGYITTSPVACGYVLNFATEDIPPPAPAPVYKKQPIPRALRAAVFDRDGWECLHCGTHEDLSADHIVPESLGGPTTFENLQTLCRSCNSRKGVRA